MGVDMNRPYERRKPNAKKDALPGPGRRGGRELALHVPGRGGRDPCLPDLHHVLGRLPVLRQLRLQRLWGPHRLYQQLLSAGRRDRLMAHPERRTMRKKLLFLTLALAATAASIAAPRAQASLIGGGPYHACPVCTTYEDGSQCCITCQCGVNGTPVICPDIGCAPGLGD